VEGEEAMEARKFLSFCGRNGGIFLELFFPFQKHLGIVEVFSGP